MVGFGADPSVDCEMEVCWFWLLCVDCCLISVDLLINSSQGETCVYFHFARKHLANSPFAHNSFLWMQSVYLNVNVSEMFLSDNCLVKVHQVIHTQCYCCGFSNHVLFSTTSLSWEVEKINGEETDNRSDSVPNTLPGPTRGWSTEGRSPWRKQSETFITILRYKRRSLFLHLHCSSAKADRSTVSQHTFCQPLWGGSAASGAEKTAGTAGEAPGPTGSGGGPCPGGKSPAQRE